MCVREVRLDFEGFVIAWGGLVQSFQCLEGIAKVIMRLSVIRFDVDRLVKVS